MVSLVDCAAPVETAVDVGPPLVRVVCVVLDRTVGDELVSVTSVDGSDVDQGSSVFVETCGKLTNPPRVAGSTKDAVMRVCVG